MVGRRVALAVALLVGLIGSQVPEFAQQYRQRLAGAVEELRNIVARFDADASKSGLDRQAALASMAGSEERLVRDQSASMEDTIARFGRLQAQDAAMRGESSFARLATLARHVDPGLAQATFDDYEPAIPTTGEGIAIAGIGFLVAYLLLFGLGSLIRPRRHRVRRKRRGRADDDGLDALTGGMLD